MSRSSPRARPGRGFVAPRFSRGAYRFARLVSGAYLRFAMGVSRVTLWEADRLRETYRSFADSGRRLLILFRHVAMEDGPLVVWSVGVGLPRWCRRAGLPAPRLPHTHFLYGKDVLSWAGGLARWTFPRIGGIPVMNGRVDGASLRTIREIATAGEFPLALAPEAQVTYHMYRVAPISGGAAAIAAWAADGPRGATILPVAIGYDYGRDEEATVRDLARRLAKATGRAAPPEADSRDALLWYTSVLLDDLESAYRSAWPAPFGVLVPTTGSGDLQARIDAACDGILTVAEAAFGYRSADATLQRVFALRYRVMEGLYREDLDPETLPSSARGLADHRSAVAAALSQHGETVDLLEYIRPDYIPVGCSVKRLVEYGLNLLDLANRMGGGNIESRYSPRGKHGYLLFGEPLAIGGPFDAAAGNVPAAAEAGAMRRPGARSRSAPDSLTARLEASFDALVAELEARLDSGAGSRSTPRAPAGVL